MVKNCTRLWALVILLATLPAAGLARQTESRLAAAAQAMGVEGLETIRYTGAGSGYTIENDNASRQHFRIQTYTQEIDYRVPVARLQIVRPGGAAGGDAAETESRIIDGNSPWHEQHQLWITPHGFLKGALAAGATPERQTVQGMELDVVTFTTGDGREVTGYINDEDLVEKVLTRFDDPVHGETAVEAAYMDYEDFGGVRFPGTIIQKRNGALVLVVIVSEVEPGVSLSIP